MSASKPGEPTGRSAAAPDPSSEAGAARAGAPVKRLTDADATVRTSRPFVENLGVVVGAFVAGTLIAEVAGAANLGTAMSFGQIAFALALVFVLVRR